MDRRLAIVVPIALLACIALPAAVSAKKVKLEVWVNPWQPLKVLQEACKGFEKKFPEVEVMVISPGTQMDLYQKLMTRVAAGSPPDLLTMQSPIAQLSDKGFLTPLNSYMKTSRIATAKNYHRALLDVYSTAGTVYAIPSIESGPELGLVYNETNLQEAGLDPDSPPKTLEELSIAHRKLTKVDPGTGVIQKWGFDPMSSMGGLYFPEMWGPVFSAPMTDKASRRPTFNTPEFIKAIDYAASFREVGTLKAYSAWRGKSPEWGPALGKGLQAMELNGYWSPGQAILANKSAKMGVAWMPNVKGDKLMVLGGWALGIPKGAKHPDISFKFIEYMAGVEPSQRIFDGMSYLTGNLQTLRELDFSKQPGPAWYIKSITSADRIQAHPDVPEWDPCKVILRTGLDKVMAKQTDAKGMLKMVQQQCDIVLDKYFKKAAKYTR